MVDERVPEPKKPLANSGLPRVRTYAGDMSRAIQSRGETLSSIVAAQQDAEQTPVLPTQPTSPQRMRLMVFGGVTLLLVGVSLLVFAVVARAPETNTQGVEVPPGIIFSNTTSELILSDGDVLSTRLAEERTTSNLSLGEIERIVVFENGALLPPSAIAERLGLPSALVREVVDLMVGIHAFDRNQPFIILKTNAYERSFNALLEWEKDAGRTLGLFYKPVQSESSLAPALTFTDEVIKNLDVRRSQPAWPVLYTFPERTLLIITTNEFTLREIISRLSSGVRTP